MRGGLKKLIIFVGFISITHGLLFLDKELTGAEVFTTSADIKKVVRELEFKLDPQKHSVIIFGFLWKAKEVGKKNPLEALLIT